MLFKKKILGLTFLASSFIVLFSYNFNKPSLEGYEKKEISRKICITKRFKEYANGSSEIKITFHRGLSFDSYLYKDLDGDKKVNELEYKSLNSNISEWRSIHLKSGVYYRNNTNSDFPPESFIFGDALLKEMRQKAIISLLHRN